MKITKKNMVIMMCTLAMVSMVPAAPVYAKTSQAYGAEARSNRSDTQKMRAAAEEVQKAFDKMDLEKLSRLCNYPVLVSYADGSMAEVKDKSQFLALGSGTFFTQGMLDAIASANVAKLTGSSEAGVQMGGDCGLALFKFKGIFIWMRVQTRIRRQSISAAWQRWRSRSRRPVLTGTWTHLPECVITL